MVCSIDIKSKVGVVLLILCSLYVFPDNAFAQNTGIDKKEIVVIGKSRVIDDNMVTAKQAAISEALLKAVEISLDRRLGSQGMLNNFPILLNEIIPVSRNWIENFNIMAETRIDNNYYILLRAKINDNLMEKGFREAGLIFQKGPSIKILFLVSQIEPQKDLNLFWWNDPNGDSGLGPVEVMLQTIFEEHGFQAVNRFLTVPEEKYAYQMTELNLNEENIIKWGKLFGADVVIYGSCKVIPYEAVTVDLIAFETQNSKKIQNSSGSETIEEQDIENEHVIQAIERLIRQTAIQLSPQILHITERPEEDRNSIVIAVKGLSSFKQLNALKGVFKNSISRVKSVQQAKVANKVVYLNIEFSGDKDIFIEEISVFDDYPFDIDFLKTGNGELTAQIKKLEFPLPADVNSDPDGNKSEKGERD